jgi:hypothetical protein
MVFIRLLLITCLHKFVAREIRHRGEQSPVPNPAGAELGLDHPVAFEGKLLRLQDSEHGQIEAGRKALTTIKENLRKIPWSTFVDLLMLLPCQ